MSNGTILVIDDQASVRFVCKTLLTAHGFEVVTAVDGRDGLEALITRAHQIDAILLDVNMPNLDGFGVLREIGMPAREADWPPVILYTSEVPQETVARAVDLAVYQVLAKPAEVATLVSAVNGAIASRRKAAA